jgi:hypothetical protein
LIFDFRLGKAKSQRCREISFEPWKSKFRQAATKTLARGSDTPSGEELPWFLGLNYSRDKVLDKVS